MRTFIIFPCTCDHCRRHTPAAFKYEARFNVGYDWEDSLTDYVCPLCELKLRLCALRNKIKKTFEAIYFAWTIAICTKHPARTFVRVLKVRLHK